MSQAFVRESDEQWLHEVGPTVSALIIYLSRQNNNIRVYEIKTTISDGREIHHMSYGLFYVKNQAGTWEIID